MPFLKATDPHDFDPTETRSQVSAITGAYSTISKFTAVGRSLQLRENLINKFYQKIDTKPQDRDTNLSDMQDLMTHAEADGFDFDPKQKDDLFKLAAYEQVPKE